MHEHHAGVASSCAPARPHHAAQPAAHLPGGPVAGQATAGPLTTAGVLHLQRTVGNAAVGRILAARAAEVRAAAPAGTVQAKTDEERADKQRRVARARQTIAELGNNLEAGLSGHIFQALPVAGGVADRRAPSGLHGYTNGALPPGIQEVAVEGSKNRVHELTWKWTGAGNPNKDSTMFPVWMPPRHVRTLIALDYPGLRANAVDGQIFPDSAREYIQHGLDIDIQQVGDTVYPVR
ncbi:MAG TPA: hypothetical protein VFE05_17205 [Longimicrobiaceae bacterium]|nr:hypothetical protein [Longimicrobiaceae bacterium]